MVLRLGRLGIMRHLVSGLKSELSSGYQSPLMWVILRCDKLAAATRRLLRAHASPRPVHWREMSKTPLVSPETELRWPRSSPPKTPPLARFSDDSSTVRRRPSASPEKGGWNANKRLLLNSPDPRVPVLGSSSAKVTEWDWVLDTDKWDCPGVILIWYDQEDECYSVQNLHKKAPRNSNSLKRGLERREKCQFLLKLAATICHHCQAHVPPCPVLQRETSRTLLVSLETELRWLRSSPPKTPPPARFSGNSCHPTSAVDTVAMWEFLSPSPTISKWLYS
ncbi:hypothetical protein TorRG33x02_200920 [Trema orientale]|uniref:Uncharacterized protein n=1 Tax=Trema orientale TaxID=63057 RepID=A0A2P5EEY8_TREOI|nr:hypothetical protein TorRG33x02_200920 [Trema orientale]